MPARPSTAAPTLLCRECKFENEPERVYCHNCGAKLDRSLLPPEALPGRRDPAKMQRQVQKLLRPSRFQPWAILKKLLFSLGFAALVACLVLAARAPLNIPDLKPEQIDNARTIDAELQTLADSRSGRAVAYTENDVNAYLKSSIHPKKGQDTVLSAKFEQLFVHFLDGNVCDVTEQLSLFDYRLYVGVEHRVTIAGGKLQATPVGGHLGRLRLPAILMKGLDALFEPAWTAEKSDKNLVERLGAISFQKGRVQLGGVPAAPATAP
ncbi:MAG: zinc ribbon domain-containing protein [Verrucomicrobia bacterium]|nr:zinc ribbon domain-containing protein [Verrucomicrobiota bacterium]